MGTYDIKPSTGCFMIENDRAIPIDDAVISDSVGYVYYVVAEDRYYVTMHPSLNTANVRNDIINFFHLPRNKIVWTTDAEYMEASE